MPKPTRMLIPLYDSPSPPNLVSCEHESIFDCINAGLIGYGDCFVVQERSSDWDHSLQYYTNCALAAQYVGF